MKKILLFLLLAGISISVRAQVQYLDSSFHYTGLQDSIATDSGLAQAGALTKMALQADGKILVALDKKLRHQITLLRLNTDGSPDLSFGIDGFFIDTPAGSQNIRLQDVAVLPNGKIVLCLNTNLSMAGTTNQLYQLIANGVLDTSFGVAGRVNVFAPPLHKPDWLYKVLLRPNGKIIVCGAVLDNNLPHGFKNMLAQYFPNGSIDSAFGTNGIAVHAPDELTIEPITALLQADGKVVTGGFFKRAIIFEGGDPFAARFDSTGRPDTSFADKGYHFDYASGDNGNYVQHIAVQSNGKLLLNMGYYGSEIRLKRLDANGQLDTNFANRGTYRRLWMPVTSGGINSTTQVLSNDSILVAYNSIVSGGGDDFMLCRVTPNGQTDSAWGDNGLAYADFRGRNDKFWDVAVQPDGKILTCGSSVNNDGTGYGYPSIARFKVVPRTKPNGIFTPAYFAGKLKLYPNPATNSVHIEGALAADKVTIWNAMGQAVLVQQINSPVLELGALPAGLYQVLVQRNGVVVGSAKLVKE